MADDRALATPDADALVERALDLRAQGRNCAQAVACALAPELGMDAEVARRCTAGFGGGMATRTETCGAVSGAVMMLGWLAEADHPDDPRAAKRASSAMVRAAVERFREANGTTVCQELKAPGDDAGCVRSCAGCVEDAVRIACDVIAGREA